MRIQCIPGKLPNDKQERRAEKELQNEHRYGYRNGRHEGKKRTGRGQLWEGTACSGSGTAEDGKCRTNRKRRKWCLAAPIGRQKVKYERDASWERKHSTLCLPMSTCSTPSPPTSPAPSPPLPPPLLQPQLAIPHSLLS